jgi:hypothetical protein
MNCCMRRSFEGFAGPGAFWDVREALSVTDSTRFALGHLSGLPAIGSGGAGISSPTRRVDALTLDPEATPV